MFWKYLRAFTIKNSWRIHQFRFFKWLILLIILQSLSWFLPLHRILIGFSSSLVFLFQNFISFITYLRFSILFLFFKLLFHYELIPSIAEFSSLFIESTTWIISNSLRILNIAIRSFLVIRIWMIIFMSGYFFILCFSLI